MNVRLGLAVLVVGMLASSLGCSHMHRVVNSGDSMLYSVTVQSGGVKCGHGYLPAGCWATYSGSMRIVRTPAPVVSWKMTENGELIVKNVELNSDPGWREVVFEIQGTNVTGRCR